MLVIAAFLTVGVAPASATRSYESQIAESGLHNPWAVTVDGSDDVWVSDPGSSGLISEYGPYPSVTKIGEQNGGGHFGNGGQYIRSLAINRANGTFNVGDSGPVNVDIFDATGTYIETLQHGFGGGYLHIATDISNPSSGALYVSGSAVRSVQAFNEDSEPEAFEASRPYIVGNAITGTPSGAFSEPWDITTDPDGNIYVVDSGKNVVDEFSRSGEFVQEFNGSDVEGGAFGHITGVAVDPSNSDVLVVDEGKELVDEFSSTAEFEGAISGAETPAKSFGGLDGGIAANSSGFIYVADGGNHVVDIFSPNVVLPKVTYEAISERAPTAGTLNASVDPNEGGNVSSCQFEYGPTAAYGSSVLCSPAPPYSTVSHIAASLTSLTTESTYHYRITLANANGVRHGADQVYTPHFVTGIEATPASDIALTHATLNGTFIGNGEDTHYYFEWGETASYGHLTSAAPGEDAGSPAGPSPTQVSLALTGLEAETTYHYRLVATNGLGGSRSSDSRFTTTGPAVAGLLTEPATELRSTSASLNGSFIGNGEDTHYYFEWGTTLSYGERTAVPPGEDAGSPTGPTPTKLSFVLAGLEEESTYYYRIVARNGEGTTRGGEQVFTTGGPVSELKTTAATNVSTTSAKLNGSFFGESLDTRYSFVFYYQRCVYVEFGEHEPNELRFCERGPDEEVPIPATDAGSTAGPTNVSTNVTGLAPATNYFYHVVASNSRGTSVGLKFGEEEQRFKTPPAAPQLRDVLATEVHTDAATVEAEIHPGESPSTSEQEPGAVYTSYHVEYGLENCAVSTCMSTAEVKVLPGSAFESVSAQLPSLTPGTTYHWRIVAKNGNPASPVFGPDQTFTTFPTVDLSHDPCSNAHVRQQTSAAGLLDCRAYELVSASNTAGYDVESGLVGNQTPFGGYPDADSPPRVLYGVHDGAIPGTGKPSNHGLDPYVATRGENGWSTQYVGIPSDVSVRAKPFASTLGEADAQLDAFAFAGPALCAPCFEDGIETGIPLHLPSGELVQGMVPSGVPDPGPSAKPDGFIGKYFSGDGRHFIFGSTSQFAPGGNSDGDISIYDRDLASGETHVVSNAPVGEDFPTPLPCLQGSGQCHSPGDSDGLAELDISNDGSHILLGQKVGTDAFGNVFWHLYMEVNDSISSIDLTPGVIASPGGPGYTEGVLYDGMTEDGDKVLFSTKDPLTSDDLDTSADLYEASIAGSTVTVARVSTGAEGTGNTDSCEPVANANGTHWNAVGAANTCGSLAIAGGAGVGKKDGSVYFLSPEKLAGTANGEVNQPNLYVAGPTAPPQFIATLSPNDAVVLDALKASGSQKASDFQVTPNGQFAAFATRHSLTEYDNAGFSEIYRFDAASDELVCVSCDPTGLEAVGESSMASDGPSLSDDGRVFFSSDEALVAADGDHREDVYEWAAGKVSLISTGTSLFDSSLLSISANGVDAYFFTRDSLVPQDQNGNVVRIYDARSLGGFPFTPQPVQCKASDECHGASSPLPGPPLIHSGAGTRGNSPSRKGHKHHHKKHHQKRRHRHHSHHKRG